MLKSIFRIESIKSFYAEYEGRIGALTLIVGFILDNLTVASVTMKSQTYVFIIFIIVGGLSILGLHYLESKAVRGSHIRNKNWHDRAHFWLFIVFQFAIGSLFSMFFAFYSRGVSIATSWPFLLILLATMIGSELWKKHYLRLSLQVSLYFIAIFSLSIYVMPIIFLEIGKGMFLLGGILSLVLIALFVKLLAYIGAERVEEWRKGIIWGVGTIYIFLNILYFTGAIPPVPLVMRGFGVHHSLQWDGVSKYLTTSEKKPWWNFLSTYPSYHHAPYDPIYVMAAVYAPTQLETTIVHEWQYYDETKEKWVTRSNVKVPIVGGRESGYRTYSMKQSLIEGKWRVNVKTAEGHIIGRLRFYVYETDVKPDLKQEVY